MAENISNLWIVDVRSIRQSEPHIFLPVHQIVNGQKYPKLMTVKHPRGDIRMVGNKLEGDEIQPSTGVFPSFNLVKGNRKEEAIEIVARTFSDVSTELDDDGKYRFAVTSYCKDTDEIETHFEFNSEEAEKKFAVSPPKEVKTLFIDIFCQVEAGSLLVNYDHFMTQRLLEKDLIDEFMNDRAPTHA